MKSVPKCTRTELVMFLSVISSHQHGMSDQKEKWLTNDTAANRARSHSLGSVIVWINLSMNIRLVKISAGCERNSH